jgi:putative peptide zinc metalloprotease protein
VSADAPLLSSLWYRVAPLRPQLLARTRLHRHHYRGERWYLLQDPASGRVHRFSAAARVVLAAMDGQRSVDDLWQLARRHLGEKAPTQDEVIQLLGQLHASDLLSTDAAPDVIEVFERGRKQAAAKRRRSWANPMAVRIPLVDPGRFLDRFVPLWQAVWGLPGALLWLAVVLPALVLLPQHWSDLSSNLSDRVLAVDNLLLIAVIFPLIKALHELGHATATRATGGEVHDMGLMLLVLMPIPYVDASSATVLRSRWRRALIGAAGMVVELFIAALAFYLWLAVEPGLVRAVCFNVMLVAGVSTIVFNGNPLLRYDAYYILSDLAELPNLGQRSTRYWGYLFERYVARVRSAVSQARTASERAWFFGYGGLSFAYRLFVTYAIAMFIATQFFFVGVVLAIWVTLAMLGMPLVTAVKQLRSRPSLRERRLRIIGGAAAAAAVLGLLAVFVPLPQRAQAEGVVWLPDRAVLRAGVAGFVGRVEAAPGAVVQAGQTLVSRFDPTLDAEQRTLTARVEELDARYRLEFVADRNQAEMVREQLVAERAALAQAQARTAALPLTAAVDGHLVLAAPADLPGRWHRKGEVMGYVLGADAPIVRVVLGQDQADLVGASTRRVGVRLADEIGRVIPAHITRQVPAAADEAPSKAFLASGGGRLAPDPRDPEGRRTLERVFQIDLALDQPVGRAVAYGQRVYVRFELAPEPLATQVWRVLRRLFLRHFDV